MQFEIRLGILCSCLPHYDSPSSQYCLGPNTRGSSKPMRGEPNSRTARDCYQAVSSIYTISQRRKAGPPTPPSGVTTCAHPLSDGEKIKGSWYRDHSSYRKKKRPRRLFVGAKRIAVCYALLRLRLRIILHSRRRYRIRRRTCRRRSTTITTRTRLARSCASSIRSRCGS